MPLTWNPPITTGSLAVAELPGDIDGTGKLIGLDADKADKAAARSLDAADGALDVDDRIALVIGLDVDIDIGPQRLLLGTDRQDAAHTRQAVGRNGRAIPLDHIALAIVVGGLDQDDLEDPLAHTFPSKSGRAMYPALSRLGFAGFIPPNASKIL